MKVKFIAVIVTLLLFLPLGQEHTRLTQYVAKVEPPPMTIQRELESVIDLISDLDSSLAEIRQMPDERWAQNFFKPVIKRRRMTTRETKRQKEESLPHLTSIMVKKWKGYAILDNQIVQVGDMVKNMKVTKIEMGKVTLRSDDRTIILTVD